MKPLKTPVDSIEIYLLQVRNKLQGLPSTQISEILAELRSHILDSISSSNVPITDATIREALEKLGAPETLAALYLTEHANSVPPGDQKCVGTGGFSSRFPWLRKRHRILGVRHRQTFLSRSRGALVGYKESHANRIGFCLAGTTRPRTFGLVDHSAWLGNLCRPLPRHDSFCALEHPPHETIS